MVLVTVSDASPATLLLEICRTRDLKLATVESCTGGLLAGALTGIAGASDVFDCGFITYSNEAKMELVGVPEDILKAHGAVSEAVARAMAEGLLTATSRAHLALAVTGIAGPSGGTAEKPVGLVHIAVTMRGGETLHRKLLLGDIGREAIRLRSVEEVLALAQIAASG